MVYVETGFAFVIPHYSQEKTALLEHVRITVLIMEFAMKMENIIPAERKGKIAKVLVKELENVVSGQVLLEFE